MDRIRLAVDMLHYNVTAADKAAQPYQDSFARLVKAHFGAGLRPETVSYTHLTLPTIYSV